MDLGPCLNTHSNVNRQRRSHTLHGNMNFIIQKYFASQNALANAQEIGPRNYANVPLDSDNLVTPVLNFSHNHHHHQPSRISHHSRSNHQRVHSQSQSQHLYHTTHGVNDLNNYYNICNIFPQHGPISRPCHSPINEPQPPMHNPKNFNCLTVMHVCNEMGTNIDSAPPMPKSRQYTISRTRNALFKVAFPQTRTMKVDYQDMRTKTFIKAHEDITVLHPSKEDRSKFTVCYNEQHFDMPHQHTLALPIKARWN